MRLKNTLVRRRACFKSALTSVSQDVVVCVGGRERAVLMASMHSCTTEEREAYVSVAWVRVMGVWGGTNFEASRVLNLCNSR